MNRRDSSNLLDRHNVAIAKILSCFRNIVTASTASIPEDGNTVEHASSTSFTMQMQTAALISEIEGLLAINRELKSLWMRGPLRQPGEDDGREAVIDAQARSVAHLYDQALAMRDAALNTTVVDRDDARARADESLSVSGS
ncbi:uncharacterized protein F4807DRAFT_414894 [Annulohypoxylon truncatum]|uniref:uncharacterized protein n=1 Tax=Annulohypoxylon truncatum TaxID=327061 RepID=UPI0020079865|nr:uncharacterized protein F4807DRAFT_414894 [Annulohypoxylon truncatum]KAI1212154.1 hypothetical protein F4807DRAFT_414894 [Annulohypoxylon truncatum]